jgi:hypothetical protein
MHHFVGFDIFSIPRGCVEHRAEVHFTEATIFHSVLEVRRELELPFPPRWPVHRSTLPHAIHRAICIYEIAIAPGTAREYNRKHEAGVGVSLARSAATTASRRGLVVAGRF